MSLAGAVLGYYTTFLLCMVVLWIFVFDLIYP